MENKQTNPTPQGIRPYEKPEMEVITLQETPQLLAQSSGAQRGDYVPKNW